jgi:AcrR family transcriptional regulator
MSEGLEEILEKSSRLMANRGFHGTSMRDLAAATGLSQSALSHYFRSKQALLFLINLQGFTALKDAWLKIGSVMKTPHERLYAFIFVHVTYFVDHMSEMRIMTWGTLALRLEKAKMIQKLKDQYTDIARQVVREVREAETDRPMEDARVSREVYLLFGMMNWMQSWYSAKTHGAPADLIDDIYGTFLGGISRPQRNEQNVTFLRDAMRDLYRAHAADPGRSNAARP